MKSLKPKSSKSTPPKPTPSEVREASLPSASIVNVLADPISIAWDGKNLVIAIRQTLKEIQTDDNLALIGTFKITKMQPSLARESARSDSPIRSARMPSTVHSPAAVRRIEGFIAAQGLGQTEFAVKAGTTDKTIRKIRKTATIKRSMLDGIAKAIGITREELLKEL